MANILFNKNIHLCGFNIGANNAGTTIGYPINQLSDSSIENVTKDSLIYSFVNKDMRVNNCLYAKYKSNALSRDRYIIYK